MIMFIIIHRFFTCSLAYWNILDLTEDTLIRPLFSANDWEEITKSFERDVTLIESDIPDVIVFFFNEVEKVVRFSCYSILNVADQSIFR